MNYLDENSHEEIKALLVGRSVQNAEGDTITLDDGTKLKIVPNQGGCACSAGDYELEKLGGFPNVITNVTLSRVDENPEDRYAETGPTKFKIFVYAEGVPQAEELVVISGDDGNGYYGTGYTIEVEKP